MSLGTGFWILMLFLVFGWGWLWWPARSPWGAVHIIVFVLLGILGWHEFGPPIHG